MTKLVISTTLILLMLVVILGAIVGLKTSESQTVLGDLTSSIHKNIPTPTATLKPTLSPKEIKAEIIRLTNVERANVGLPAFKENSLLNQSATIKAKDMYERGYWNHVTPDGKEPWHTFRQVDYVYQYAGENLGRDYNLTEDYYNARILIDAWVESPEHKVNLLNSHYNEIGVGLSPNSEIVVVHYGSQRPVYNDNPIATNTTPSRTGNIIPYHDWCNNKDISVYENEIVVKKSSDGNIYGMTAEDWECYEKFLKQKK